MNWHAMRVLLAALVLLGQSAAAVGGDFEKGLRAFERKEFATALAEWRALAETGHVKAMHGMSVLYFNGLGVEKDEAEAFRLARLAAEEGYAPAQRNLGNAYLQGLGVDEDIETGVEWMERAASQGDARAQMLLGGLYVVGIGLRRSYPDAFRWLSLAADQGLEPAMRLKDRVRLMLSPAEIEAADRVAAADASSTDIEGYLQAIRTQHSPHKFDAHPGHWRDMCARVRYWFQINQHGADFDSAYAKQCAGPHGYIQTILDGASGVMLGGFVLTMWNKAHESTMTVLLDCGDCKESPRHDDIEHNLRIIAYHLKTGVVFPELLKR